jgi:predicted alpha/beta superfamily hydrolase
MKHYHILLLIFLINITLINAQTSIEKITIGNKIVFTSKMYNEERILLVSLPENYNESNKNYPVIYRLDGESIFLETITETKRLTDLQEFIIVCIQNVDRGRDMLPSISQYSPKDGSNEKFLLFFKNELIPYIDNNYRTSDFKILCGQSTSGLFTLFTFLQEPGLFNAYIAISPSSADCKPYMQDLAYKSTMTDERRKSLVHLSRGGDDREKAIGLSTSHLLDIILDKGKDRNDKFTWQFSVFEDEGHVPRSGYYEGLKWILIQMNQRNE